MVASGWEEKLISRGNGTKPGQFKWNDTYFVWTKTAEMKAKFDWKKLRLLRETHSMNVKQSLGCNQISVVSDQSMYFEVGIVIAEMSWCL
jgi:hypothetical protein